MSSNPLQSTRESRQSIHPLLLYDPGILKGGIQLLKLEYLESEKTKAPVPRNQEVPKSAFGTLTGRSVLVATSHAWFHQCHPDPHGVKLRIMRKEFFPRLRKRFPYTQILIFDDWHSCPQWPRTTKENLLGRKTKFDSLPHYTHAIKNIFDRYIPKNLIYS